MKWNNHRLPTWVCILAVALLFLLLPGCVEPIEPLGKDPNATELILRISIPGQSIPTTKAGTDLVNSISPESQIYSLQVWVFNHQNPNENAGDNETAVAYAQVNLASGWSNTVQRVSGYYDAWSNTTTYEVPISFPQSVLDRETGNMKFDFYVLANGSSIDNPADRTKTRRFLKDLAIGTSYFGVTSPKTGTKPVIAINGSETANGPGLPISGFFNKKNNSDTEGQGIDLSFLKTQPNITAADMHKLVPVVQLTRAVSKIRFVFAKPTGTTGSITRIVINEDQIPKNTFVFPREADVTQNVLPTNAENQVEYVSSSLELDGVLTDHIMELSNPEDLKRSNSETSVTWVDGETSYSKKPSEMTEMEYQNCLNYYVDQAISSSDVKQGTQRFIYLRESDKKIKGTIYFKRSATEDEEPAPFEMDADASFYRNHSLTVYAFFKGDGLFITPVVLPWIGAGEFSYTTPGTAVVKISTQKEVLFGYGYTTANTNPWWLSMGPYISITTQYSSSPTSTQGDWSSTAPSDYSNNKYFWIRSSVKLTDGDTPTYTYSDPIFKSPKVVGTKTYNVSGITVQYASGASTSVTPTEGWSDSAPEWNNTGKCIWIKVATTYTNSNDSEDTLTDTDYVCMYNKDNQYNKETEWYFRRMDEGYESAWDYDWLHSQMVVAPGTNEGGFPIYANRIELVTNSFAATDKLYLKITPDEEDVDTEGNHSVYHFDIITYNLNTGAVQRSTDGSVLLNPGSVNPNGVYFFYVVPKDETDEHIGKKTAAYLTLVPNSGNSQKLPFNTGLFPGSNENTEIFFFSVSVSDFVGYYYPSSRPNYIKPYTYEPTARYPAHIVEID